MIIKNLNNYGGTISEKVVVEGDVHIYGQGEKAQCLTQHVEAPPASFRDLVQHENPDLLIERLHRLIDGRRGADVGCVLLKCLQDGYLTRRPKQKEFESEFTLTGGWKAIHNYMDDNNENALDRANKIVIF